MVSLSRNLRQPGGGMTFFSDSLNSQYHDDDPLLESMPIIPQEPAASRWMAEELRKYRPISTPKAILFAKFLYASLAAAAYVLPILCKDEGWKQQDVQSLLYYIHGGMWFLLLLVHLYLHQEHTKSLLHGYFAFHIDTRTLKRAPLFINSAANAVMVVVIKLLDAVCHHGETCPLMSRTRYIQVLFTLEAVIALAFLIVYFVRTVKFNKAKAIPDFLRAGSAQSNRLQSQIGYRDGGYKQEKRRAAQLLWYELYFWKEKRISLCQDILSINDKLQQVRQRQPDHL